MEHPALKILLMGNPNVGKSVIFSRLTGIEVISANYPGTTVEYTEGRMKLGEQMATLVDAPGVYSLDPTSRVEEVSREIFLKGADVVVNVIDATNLERNLNLTLQILEWGVPTVVALNLWDVATRKGIEIDVAALEKELGVPVVPTVAVSGQGIRDLVGALAEAKTPPIMHFDLLGPEMGPHRRDRGQDAEGHAPPPIPLRPAGGHLHQAVDGNSHRYAGALFLLQPGD